MITERTEEQQNELIQMLLDDYCKMIKGDYESDTGILYGFELIFDWYLSQEQLAQLELWKHATLIRKHVK